ncbi:MAG: aspartate carbamoyltransferase catalytic subunit [Chloroflexi bacterium]|nr:aspartate carbamoyltransferase catalytic subunit [Chloroflexota bacterium]
MATLSRTDTQLGDRQQPEGLQHHHVLDLDDFSREELELVFQTTDGMREILTRDIKKAPALRGKMMVTLFYEASTRTRMSFELAGKILSADVVNLTASASSVTKGESLVDTVKTIQAMGVDVIVMRHPSSGAPYLVAQQVQASVVNGGDGWHAHPTQALLDLYTMRERCGALEGLKVAIVGDVLHSRVARSNLWGLAAVGAQVVLCGPPTLLPREWDVFGVGNREQGVGSGEAGKNLVPRSSFLVPDFAVTWDLREALAGADVVMTLRLQRERQEGGLLPSLGEYITAYQINRERLAWAKPDALLMHPGPVNEGVELAADLVRGVQSVIDQQVTNGLAIRMALLYLLAGGPQ